MSFLAPLYTLAALAIAFPILFHLFQRTPRGRQIFGSLMFLKPTPPKITRRSRLSDLLLLLLRALALILLALAFCRPFLRSLEQLTGDVSQRRVAILIDRSASMQREGAWQQVQDLAKQVLKELDDQDQVALYSFAADTTAHVSIDAIIDRENNRRLVEDALRNLRPTWESTNLGQALVTVADALQASELDQSTAKRKVVLLTDFQEGADLTALQSFNWPDDVPVDLRTVKLSPQNAALHPVDSVPEGELEPDQFRIRIANERESTTDKFDLVWVGPGPTTTIAKTVQVVPGRNRVMDIERPVGAEILKLSGDDHPFDNQVYFAQNPSQPRQLVFVGPTTEAMDGGLLYFLQRAPLGTPQRPIEVVEQSFDSPLKFDVKSTALVVFVGAPRSQWLGVLKPYLTAGGRLLVVMDPSEVGETTVLAPELATMLEIGQLQFERIESADYAMLTNIDFQHRLFAAFNDAKFNDFTKIRFWEHYRATTNHEQPWRVLARFDDNTPALVEKEIGEGTCWIFNSGWNSRSSQFALSTKFVPFLVMMTENRLSESRDKATRVGQAIDFEAERYESVTTPAGDTIELEVNATRFEPTGAPGLYTLARADEKKRVAVHLDPNESRVAPLDLARLEQWGVPFDGIADDVEVSETEQRQLKNFELEGRQKLWRWLIVAALAVLAMETYYAGRSSTTLATKET